MLTGADTLSGISEPSNKQKVQKAAAATHTWELQFSQKKPIRDSDAEKSLKLCVCVKCKVPQLPPPPQLEISSIARNTLKVNKWEREGKKEREDKEPIAWSVKCVLRWSPQMIDLVDDLPLCVLCHCCVGNCRCLCVWLVEVLNGHRSSLKRSYSPVQSTS